MFVLAHFGLQLVVVGIIFGLVFANLMQQFLLWIESVLTPT